jgi:arsenate reductase
MDKVRVLFLCKGNPARGQIAEGFLNAEAGDRFVGVSAATSSTALNPLATEVMQEVGIDISSEHSKTIPEVFRERFSYVVGIFNEARELAPVFPFTYQLMQWSLEDPVTLAGSREEQIGAFRQIRDQINANVHEFLKTASAEIAPASPALRVAR